MQNIGAKFSLTGSSKQCFGSFAVGYLIDANEIVNEFLHFLCLKGNTTFCHAILFYPMSKRMSATELNVNKVQYYLIPSCDV